MTLPFFYYKNWLSIPVRADFQSMGTISIDSAGVLLNANSVAGEAVGIQVYAWAENVEVAGPTTTLALQSSTVKLNKKRNPSVSRSKGLKGTKPSLKPQKAVVPKIKSGNSFVNFNEDFKDEYGQGVVSTTASAIASATGALSSVPVIGPYMTATSFVANAASSVANFFGWSNPPVVADVQPYKNVPFHALASSEISTPIEKLAYDPKTELCVDSRTVGLDGTDELSVESFVTRESYLFNFFWAATDAADALLFSSLITPHLCDTNDETPNAVYGVPMAYLTRMFRQWHGDIIFRFKIVCSQYHRGRFRISWDPATNIDAVTDTETVTYTQTFDITESNDIELRIPWMQTTTWQNCDEEVYQTQLFGATSPAYANDRYNGCLNFRVLTKQTSPVASANIRVLVFVRGAENLQFANPREIPNTLSHFPYPLENQSKIVSILPPVPEEPEEVSYVPTFKRLVSGEHAGIKFNEQSKTVHVTPVLKDDDLEMSFLVCMREFFRTVRALCWRSCAYAPIDSDEFEGIQFVVQSETVMLNSPLVDSDIVQTELGSTRDEIEASYLVYMGEVIKSLRTVLRRDVLHRFVSYDTETALLGLVTNIVQNRYPVDYGFDPNGIHWATDPTGLTSVEPFNFVTMTYMNWLAPCFRGQRGAVNWRMNFNGRQNDDTMKFVRLPHTTRTALTYTNTTAWTTLTKWTFPAQVYQANWYQDNSGTHITNQKTQAGCAASVPQYSRFRMTSTDPNYLVLGKSTDETTSDSMGVMSVNRPSTNQNANTTHLELYCSAGIDYTLFFFLNIPAVYVYTAVPAVAAPP